LDASIGQATRLADATERANQNVLQADRPWIGGNIHVSNFEAGKKPIFTFQFVNSGRRPAEVYKTNMRTGAYAAFPENPEDEFAGIATEASTNIVIPGQDYTTILTPQTELSERGKDALDSGVLVFYAFARVRYRDVRSHADYWTHICMRYYPIYKTETDPGFRNCARYNDAN
jgi:hypothetical protein